MRQQSKWLMAVTLFLLLVLAACGGGTDEQEAPAEEAITDVEATGSESAGDILPTPITGAKALPTRASAALTPDILLIGPSTLLTAVDLETIASQSALPNARFALALYGDTGLTGVFDFTEEIASLTAVLATPEAATSPLTLSAALAEGLQLPGWRPDSNPRLTVLVVDETLPDEEVLTLAAAAVSQNIRLTIIQGEGEADWTEVAEIGNGRVLLLPENQTPGSIGTAVTTLISEIITETTP